MEASVCATCAKNVALSCASCARLELEPALAALRSARAHEHAAKAAATTRGAASLAVCAKRQRLDELLQRAHRLRHEGSALSQTLVSERTAVERRRLELSRRRAVLQDAQAALGAQASEAAALAEVCAAPLREAVAARRRALCRARRRQVLGLLELFAVRAGAPASIAGVPLTDDAPEPVRAAARAHVERLTRLVARVLRVRLPSASPLALAVLCISQGVPEGQVAVERPLHNLVLLVQAPDLGVRAPQLPPMSALAVELSLECPSPSAPPPVPAAPPSAPAPAAGEGEGEDGDDDDEWDLIERPARV